MRFSRLVYFAFATASITTFGLQGCGDGNTVTGDVCSAAAACKNAPIPTQSQIDQCNVQLKNVQCGEQFRLYKECITYRAKCTTSGSLDSSGTSTGCRAEQTAYSQCTAGMTDGGLVDGCKPRTCAQASANCGEIDNGCGQKIQCGTCTSGQTCGGGGSPNRCGCACDPTWCGTLSACGTTITCPSVCQAPQYCGGGGIANRCGCTPSGALGPLTSAQVSTSIIPLDGGTQVSWSNPAGARTSDSSYASAPMATGAQTQFLVALSYGATLPATAVVDGITVQVERSATGGIATVDNAVHLVKNTQILSAADNKASNLTWGAAETTVSYGGPTDKWGSTWTAAEINQGGFGVAFSAKYIGVNGNETARVDAIRVTVHYSGVACP